MEKDDGKLYRQKVQVKRKCCSCRNIGKGLRGIRWHITRYSLALPGGVWTRQRGGEGGPGGDDGRVRGVGVGVASEGQRGVQLGRGAWGRRQGGRGLRGDVGDPHHRLVLGVPVDDGI